LLLWNVEPWRNILWHIICFINSLKDITPGAMKKL